MQDTLTLWEDLKQGKYDVYLSYQTIDETTDCPQPKRDILFDFFSQIEYTTIERNKEISELAQEVINMKILMPKSFDDCIHIAAAIISGCDYIVSWNFRHLVNIKTINGVRAITALRHYPSIDIVQPTLLIQSEEEQQ